MLIKSAVLIIDDNEADRYILKRQLKKVTPVTKIFEADDGRTALDFLEKYQENIEKYGDEYPPIIIFLDINMPVLNGFEFLESFKQLRQETTEYKSTVLMMFTTSEREEEKQKAFSHDFVKGYLVKGQFDSEKLKTEIDKSLNA